MKTETFLSVGTAMGLLVFVTQPTWGPFVQGYHNVRNPDSSARSAVRSDTRLSQLTYKDVCDAKPAVEAGHVFQTVGGLIVAKKAECGPAMAIARFETNIADLKRTVFVVMPSEAKNERLVTSKKPALAL